ncbi:MAG: response regulator [Myxococcota bacterium]|nr:response regulator [Myxococcota bacterium]
MSNDRFGDYLMHKGMVRREEVILALEVQAESTVKVGTICLEERYMTAKQVMDTLRHQADNQRPFEDLAISLGYLTAQQLGTALKIQSQRRPFFGEVLVKLGLLSRSQLFEELGHFWNHVNKKPANPDSGDSAEASEKAIVEIDFPLMYPEELGEFKEDLEHSLQKIAIELTNLRPGSDLTQPAGTVAFLANKMRGVAELDGVKWLVAVAGEMEQGMLLVAEAQADGDKDPHVGLPVLVQTYFRAADCIQNFLDSIQGNMATADNNILDELRKCREAYGTLDDIVSQEKIAAAMGDRGAVKVTRKSVAGARLLLIDDDTVIRNSLERYLRGLQMDIAQAKNGALGLEHLLQDPKPYDIVIVDLHMPIMDGFEFVTEVKSRPKYADLPIIMFTASLHMADVRKAIHLGLNGYVIKREWKNCLLPELERGLGVENAGPSTSLQDALNEG